MRSVGEKFTFCLLKIGGSSSSFMCMNPVVLCKTEIFENTHKIYIYIKLTQWHTTFYNTWRTYKY
jgi:hypothetical protein